MTLKPAGVLDCYNSLTDEYLVDYFNNKRIRKHLRDMGLITRRGEVVDEPTFRYNTARKEHRSHVKELMSQAVINKTLELERNRRAFIRDKLIEIRKIETVNRIKRERDNPDDRNNNNRPKSAPTKLKGRTEAECVAGVSIPPGSTVKWVPLIVPPSGSTPYLAPRVPGLSRQPVRPKSAMVRSKRNHNQLKQRPKSASSAATSTSYGSQSNFSSFIQRRQIHSMSRITLRYLGKSLDLSPGVFGDAVNVLIMQQHCGGNTVCVYQGLVSPNECFTFTSRRHRDAPFGITIYIGSMQDTRLSTCCEYKHRPGHILGGKSGHFALVRVDGCLPCYKCFAHVDEFKKQQSAAHNKFQQSVKSSKKSDVKGKKKRKKKKDKTRNSSSSSDSGEEVEKPILEATVTVKSKKDERTTTNLAEVGDEDIKQFEKLVAKTDHPSDEEDALVLHSSDSDEEMRPSNQEEELKLQSESSSEEEKAPVIKDSQTNGYDEEKFHSDDDDKKSDSSVASTKSNSSIKSEASIKSNESVKSNASIKSDSTIKSEASIRSNGSVKSQTSIKSESSNSSKKSDKSDGSKKSDKSDSSKHSVSSNHSSSSVHSDKNNSSASSIKSEDSIKNSTIAESDGDKAKASDLSPKVPEATSDVSLPAVTSNDSAVAAKPSQPSTTLEAPSEGSTAPELLPQTSVSSVESIAAPLLLSQNITPVASTPPTEATFDNSIPQSTVAESVPSDLGKEPGETPDNGSSEVHGKENGIRESSPERETFAKEDEIRRQDAGLGSRVLKSKDDSDNESEMSIHSNHSNLSDTTTNASATQLKVLSPTQSILSTESSKSKDPNRHIRFSDTVIQRVASEDEFED